MNLAVGCIRWRLMQVSTYHGAYGGDTVSLSYFKEAHLGQDRLVRLNLITGPGKASKDANPLTSNIIHPIAKFPRGTRYSSPLGIPPPAFTCSAVEPAKIQWRRSSILFVGF